jgi:O-antigen/teichoic acid export membrane protein
MRSRKRVTKWNIFFHYYSIAFAMVSGILIVPLYLKYIPLELYGAWLATGNIVTWLTIVDPGLSDVLRQRVGQAYGAGHKHLLNDYLNSGALLSLVVSTVILLAGMTMSPFIADLISFDDRESANIVANAFLLAVTGSSLMILSFGFTSFNQGLLSSVGIGLIFVVATLTSLLIKIVLLVNGFGLYSIPAGVIIQGSILVCGNIGYIALRYFKESISFKISFKGFWNLAKLSSYNFLGRIGTVIPNHIDSFLVARFLGAEIAPILNLTQKGPTLSKMFVERPPMAMLPAITNAWGNGEYDKVRLHSARLFIIMIWVLGLIATGFILLNKYFVQLWVGSELYAGHQVNLLVCLTVLLSVVVSVTSNIFFALGKIKETSRTHFMQGLLTLIMLYTGVKFFGMTGLVAAQLMSLIIFSSWYFPYKTFQLINFAYSDRKQILNEIIKSSIISLVIIVIFSNIIYIGNWNAFVVYVSAVILLYIIILFLFSKIFRKETINLLRILRSLKIN